MNGRVLITDKNGEVARRLIVVEVNKEVSEETKRKFPLEKIYYELSGIFNIVMDAFCNTIERGMKFDMIDKMIEWRDIWLESNDVIKQFLESSFDADSRQAT